MLEEAKGTIGIGAKTARSIQCTFTKKAFQNHQTSANNARQRKKTEPAKCKQKNR